jgi:hypothetical protein
MSVLFLLFVIGCSENASDDSDGGNPIGASASGEIVEGCVELQKVEAETNRTLPRPIDNATEFVNVRVNCDTKTVVYTKKILVDVSLLPRGWEVRKQRQHSQLHCNQQGLASVGGWTAVDNIYDSNMNFLAALVTEPTDCTSAYN